MSRPRPCEICKQLIDPERSDALPDTRLCTEHAREIAKYGGEFLVVAEQERTSKPGSLKRNYGGISTSRLRNQAAVDKLRRAYEGRTE